MRVLLIFFMILAACASEDKKAQEIANLHLEMGTAYLVKRKYPQALRELLAAETNNPNDPLIQNNLGIAYFTLKKNATAVEHLKKALSLREDYSDARNNLGRVYIEMGLYDEAISQLQKVAKDLTYATPHKALVNLGIAYFHAGKLNEAKRKLLETLQIDRSNCLAHNYYGRTLLQQQQFVEASASLDKAINFCKELSFDEPHYYSGMAYLKLGQTKKAMARFNEIIELYPDGKFVDKSKDQLKSMRVVE